MKLWVFSSRQTWPFQDVSLVLLVFIFDNCQLMFWHFHIFCSLHAVSVDVFLSFFFSLLYFPRAFKSSSLHCVQVYLFIWSLLFSFWFLLPFSCNRFIFRYGIYGSIPLGAQQRNSIPRHLKIFLTSFRVVVVLIFFCFFFPLVLMNFAYWNFSACGNNSRNLKLKCYVAETGISQGSVLLSANLFSFFAFI